MNKRVARRLLDTFFRRRWLYLLPVMLLTLVGVAAASSGSGYQSVGVIDVAKDTLLSDLTSIRGENFGFETPATSTAKTINALMGTDNFITSIAKSAGVTGALSRGELTAEELRTSILVTPDGDNLVKVIAVDKQPGAVGPARAGHDGDVHAVHRVRRRRREPGRRAVLQRPARRVPEAAGAGADRACGTTPRPTPAARRTSVHWTNRSRSSDSSRRSSRRKRPTRRRRARATKPRLATEQSVRDVSQQLRIIDTPEVPGGPIPRLKTAVFTVGLFRFVGMLISFGAVVLASVMDRSLRASDDVEQLLGMPALAVVPDATQTSVDAGGRQGAEVCGCRGPSYQDTDEDSHRQAVGGAPATARSTRALAAGGRVTTQRSSGSQGRREARDQPSDHREDPSP